MGGEIKIEAMVGARNGGEPNPVARVEEIDVGIDYGYITK